MLDCTFAYIGSAAFCSSSHFNGTCWTSTVTDCLTLSYKGSKLSTEDPSERPSSKAGLASDFKRPSWTSCVDSLPFSSMSCSWSGCSIIPVTKRSFSCCRY